MSNIVFFLGSGFSKAIAGIPTQDKFLKDVLNKGWKDRVIEEFEGMEKKMAEKCKNIEFLTSYLFYCDTYDRQKNGKRKYKPYKTAMINFQIALNDYLKEHLKINKCDGNEFIKQIRYLIKKEHKISFVTTNYDLVLEKLLERVKDRHWKHIFDNENNDDQNKEIPILKLHGSINWLEKRKVVKRSAKNKNDKKRELVAGVSECQWVKKVSILL